MNGAQPHLLAEGAAARDLWRQALERDASALVWQTPAWMDCVCEVSPYEDATRVYAAGADADADDWLVLPLARRRVAGAPATAHSMPFGWGTGGLISSRGELRAEDVAAVVEDLRRQRELLIAVRPAAGSSAPWAQSVPGSVLRIPYMSQTIDLAGGFDAVWSQRFAATVRSHCRKAERRGVTAERDDTGRLMRVFDHLYRLSVDRWAANQHEPPWLARWRARRRDPPQKFMTVARRLGRDCRVWVASRDGQPIAALLVLVHGHHSHMWRAAIDKDAVRGTGAGELLHAQVIEEACAEGCRYFHLGDSAPSSTLAANKRKFGGEEFDYAGYRFERVPLTAADQFLRRQVKRVIGFRG